MTEYQAHIEKEDDGRWSAWIEELPGCAAWGYSRDEAQSALADALAVYLEDVREEKSAPLASHPGADTPIAAV